MIESHDIKLPDWAPIVLASANKRLRPILAPALLLDTKLARLALSGDEPALAQLKLAWWRDELRLERCSSRALPPDPLLASLVRTWTTFEPSLVALVDGWEKLVGGPPWDSSAADAFASGRSALFEGLTSLLGYTDYIPAATAHGEIWARADFLHFSSMGSEQIPTLPSLPRELRPLAMIGGLSARAIKRGGRSLFGDRLSPFVALRLGIFGT